MIVIEKLYIGEIAALHIVNKDNYDQKLPYIQFTHGFTSAKEHNLHFAYNLAEKGFRVVLPDCLYHGERDQQLSSMELNVHFWDIVIKTIDEIAEIKEYFDGKGLIDDNSIGLVGTSMGGIVTLGAMRKYPWIHAAVSLMGMPYYEKFAKYTIEEVQKRGYKLPLTQVEIDQLIGRLAQLDLSKVPEALETRPLMFWHGKKDEVVPYAYSRQFYEQIKPLYQEAPEKLIYITEENAGHKVSRKAMLKTVEWFETHLEHGFVKL
ncbi:alpha/beta fold hydrolase [Bacillus sp. B1-b2]|uniref:alpha/beta fold hydrolase n=1 Tax=Bacillus sp. B1-b2 TaxID=2653201 RepID=UPI0012617134|nr:alpha/beta fold hydrolase [Bacillus sp. B1-b2]KAB7664710.1 prolyl oligopeptidase family serine peptidase [Bacillus sp. B1-b2]